jgi:hypothetical protein
VVKKAHTVTFADGETEPCLCPASEDHPSLIIDGEEYVDVGAPWEDEEEGPQ